MARGLSVPGEHSLSALQAYSVTQCGCHLTRVPQEHTRKIMTPEGLGPPLEQRSLTAWLTLETQPSPQPGPSESRSTSQAAACSRGSSSQRLGSHTLGD